MSVVVEPYNPQWPTQFNEIKRRLSSFLTDIQCLSIEHVGSTSVPDLAAKPIIDITIICTRLKIQLAIDTLVANGFTYLGELGCVDRHALRDPEQNPARNVYVAVEGSAQVRNHIGVRDVLRQDKGLREEYATVKLGLAARGVDIIEYVEAKSEIIQKILKQAGLLSDSERAEILAANMKGERFAAIKTERLVLREFVMRDVEGFYELESKEDVVRYQTWPPRTREEAEREVVTVIRSSNEVPRQHYELVVTLDGRFIGRVGAMFDDKLLDTDQQTEGSDTTEKRPALATVQEEDEVAKQDDPRHVSLWFSFLPEVQGKGFATEAMKAFIPLLGSPRRLEIECDPRNTGSWKMAERLGFEKIRLSEKDFQCKGEWVDSLVYQKVV